MTGALILLSFLQYAQITQMAPMEDSPLATRKCLTGVQGENTTPASITAKILNHLGTDETNVCKDKKFFKGR